MSRARRLSALKTLHRVQYLGVEQAGRDLAERAERHDIARAAHAAAVARIESEAGFAAAALSTAPVPREELSDFALWLPAGRSAVTAAQATAAAAEAEALQARAALLAARTAVRATELLLDRHHAETLSEQERRAQAVIDELALRARR